MTPLENLIALAEASVAAGVAQLKRETEAHLCEQAGTLDRIVREHEARSERHPHYGPRIAPKRIARPEIPLTSREPDTFVVGLARRLQG